MRLSFRSAQGIGRIIDRHDGVITVDEMRWIFTLALLSAGIALASVDWPFPSADGTTWEYTLLKEPEHTTTSLTRQVVPATESDSVQIDSMVDGEVESSQRLKKDGGKIVSAAEANENGDGPPVTVLPQTLDRGAKWDFHGQVAAVEVTLPLIVVAKEPIDVPAGHFDAWHIHGERQTSFSTSVDEWFAPGVGCIKETVTQRAPSGDLLARNTLELVKAPDNASSKTQDSLEVSLSTSTAGEPLQTISADALQIVARWRMRDALPHTKIRAVWIAENVPDVAPPDYQVDEATAIADGPETVGSFKLERPPDGWTPGAYRVDFYVSNRLAETVKLTIAQTSETKF